jgi:hypothetical protein
MARVSCTVYRGYLILTIYSPSTYALTLTREDVMVWIMNHDVSLHLLKV